MLTNLPAPPAMKPPPASGRASALRVIIAATSTPIFKTRNTPCRIAVRAEMEKLRNSMKNRTHLGAIWTSIGADRYRIQWFDHLKLRFSENRKPKTENSQRRCNLRFPYGTCRSHSNGLLEQMPQSGDRRASTRRALIATSPLRSNLIVTPRSHSATAKSKLSS
jgi:hypothetical protein